MTQRLVIPLLAVVAFGAGFSARMWTEGDRALPPPPPIGSEFLPTSGEKKPAPRPINRAQLMTEIEKLRPQIDEYRVQIAAMDADLEKALVALLNPDQLAVYHARAAKWKKDRAEHDAKNASAAALPLSDEEIATLRQRPFESAFWKVCYTGRLERDVRDLNLDAGQQAKLRALLTERRNRYIALVDSIPPPTFRLTSLATSVQRLTEPQAAAAQAK
jgi:hypothetical protein